MRNTRDYQKGKIYSIRSPSTDKVYYGSTTQTLTKRLSLHNAIFKQYVKDNYCHVRSFDIIAYGDAYIELVENYPCTTKEELLRREGEVIRLNKDVAVNKIISGRTKREYYEDHIDKIKAGHKKYGKDKATEISANKKQYYKSNIDKIKQYRTIKTVCSCGGQYTNNHRARHMNSAMHIEFIANENNKDMTKARQEHNTGYLASVIRHIHQLRPDQDVHEQYNVS